MYICKAYQAQETNASSDLISFGGQNCGNYKPLTLALKAIKGR